jgi:O-acetyl-ADP-ribose deacetylase (regulator of RNase III)
MEKPKNPKEPKEKRSENINQVTVKLFYGDVIKVPSSVLVCPTNKSLQRNSGMTEHIIRSAGARVHYDKNNWRRENEALGEGGIFVNGGGNIPVNHIFFTNVPVCNKSNPEPQVKLFISRILQKLEELQAGTITVPCLPREAYGYLPENCAFGYLSALQEYLSNTPHSQLKEVKIVTIDKQATKIFLEEFDRRFGEKKEKKGIFSFLKRKKKKEGDDLNIELK